METKKSFTITAQQVEKAHRTYEGPQSIIPLSMERGWAKVPSNWKLATTETELMRVSGRRSILAYQFPRLKEAFWKEHAITVERCLPNTKMRMEMILGEAGLTQDQFANAADDPYFVAWLMIPPVEYMGKVNAILDLALDQVANIIAMKTKDPKMIALKVKCFQLLDMRAKGAPVQRVHQVTEDITPDKPKAEDGSVIDVSPSKVELEDLNSKIRLLEEKLGGLREEPPVPNTFVGLEGVAESSGE